MEMKIKTYLQLQMIKTKIRWIYSFYIPFIVLQRLQVTRSFFCYHRGLIKMEANLSVQSMASRLFRFSDIACEWSACHSNSDGDNWNAKGKYKPENVSQTPRYLKIYPSDHFFELQRSTIFFFHAFVCFSANALICFQDFVPSLSLTITVISFTHHHRSVFIAFLARSPRQK